MTQDRDNKQVDVQEVCEHLGIGRYDLIELATFVARSENFDKPQEALVKLLTITDLDAYLETLKEKVIKEQFRG